MSIGRTIKDFIFRPLSRPAAYFFAVAPQLLLFVVSKIVSDESEVIFTLMYVGFAASASFFCGKRPGLLAALLASFSVDFYYIHPSGHLFNTWRSFALLILTLVFSFGAAAIANWVAVALRTTNQAKVIAENAIREREQLMAVIAHDLRQPLSSISLQNEIAIERLKIQDFDGAMNFLTKGNRTIKMMEHMIRDLLDISQMEQGKFKVKLESNDLNVLLNDSTQRLQDLAHQKKIQLSFSGVSHPALVSADPDQLHRVIFNLVGNSLKFTPSPGKITIAVEERNDGYQVLVADTGPGVKPENIKSLFTKNWQDQKTAHLGSGLGLFICKGIIIAHHGSIGYFTGKDGGGATFYFVLPKLESKAPAS